MLYETLSQIKPLDRELMASVKHRVDHLIKPQGSLGALEDIVVKLAGMTGNPFPMTDKKAIVVMCADHGVCDEYVASAPQSVTLQQARNIPRGLTGVGSIAKQSHTKLYSVDIGINTDFEDAYIISHKLMHGTDNMRKGPAMTREVAVKALEIGIQMAYHAIDEGANILGTGEMGIGNTTPSTAILSVLTGQSPFEITGMGANFPADKLKHKATVINDAIVLNKPDASDPIDILAKVGGLDIAGMAGTMIGGAAKGVPVVIDGFIATVAALIACELSPSVKDYLLPSHASLEKGAKLATDTLGLEPFIHMNLRLGEGSGALLAFSLIEAACYMNKEMITFDEAGIGIV
ncbi:MAG: nicotinate-nucleotide--dimethylbenzimidazole phosphoribosyltransferase [Clostridiales bacterium]|nr:nicotinate-nucleotide--dimethylbenzimidazole phosphoribosyltransferase [Clostridiales bacterium]